MRNETIDIMISRVLAHEGGYVHHPRDPGGETNYGITKKTARAYGYIGKMREMPKATAVEIYRALFIANKAHELRPKGVAISYQYFDATINHGSRIATKMLQRTVGAKADGVLGDKTLQALESYSEIDLVHGFIAQRLWFYSRLKHFGTFGRGWARRVADNLSYLSEDLNDEAINHQ